MLKIVKENKSLEMLNHDFYKNYWNEGLLSRNDLAQYVKQYYYIEKTFIDCLKILLKISKKENKEDFLKIITENLSDELGAKTGKSHLDLLKDFASEFNVSFEEVLNVSLNFETKILIDNFLFLSKKNLYSGIAVLYAYEYQIPKIAKSKINGLKKYYGVTKKESLNFFKTHLIVDKWHKKQWESLIINFSDEELLIFNNSFNTAMKVLNLFLDGIMLNFKVNSNLIKISI